MISLLLVCLVAFLASALTLFSGFGLGTLLLPAFALVFPPQWAVACTALVHLTNNLFKLALIGKHAQRATVLAFGLPALVGALVGAFTLKSLANLPVLGSYSLGGKSFEWSAMKLAIGILIIAFAILELRPKKKGGATHPMPLTLGGLGSGFFGGLSGHQGALRSAVLIGSGLSKEAFVATGVWCAVFVDIARISIYGVAFLGPLAAGEAPGPGLSLLIAATLCAFTGAYVGVRMLGKVTLDGLRRLVGVMLLLVGAALALGWL
jgi:uncharacterized membrane protein YfcA